jgi:hypothetical protein
MKSEQNDRNLYKGHRDRYSRGNRRGHDRPADGHTQARAYEEKRGESAARRQRDYHERAEYDALNRSRLSGRFFFCGFVGHSARFFPPKAGKRKQFPFVFLKMRASRRKSAFAVRFLRQKYDNIESAKELSYFVISMKIHRKLFGAA